MTRTDVILDLYVDSSAVYSDTYSNMEVCDPQRTARVTMVYAFMSRLIAK